MTPPHQREEGEERPGMGVKRRPLLTDPPGRTTPDPGSRRHFLSHPLPGAKRIESWNDGDGHSTPQGRREPRISTSRPRGGPKRILRPLEFCAPGHATRA
ncbi:hypothetical protein G5I_13289 [Acromyrmex echinatior]|uniref:Uncharacterized protein n=1 Tax=Acromyrmex echinatior TaxID=103372 RepID=F4X4M3_ACREC|nr:hypothetical protein G5I_13289 [Acromyrmex echinatior]